MKADRAEYVFSSEGISGPAVLLKTVLSFMVCLGALNASAQTTWIKANNTTALTTDGSWTTSGTPASGDIAVWNSAVSNANSVALGGAFSIGEIQIVNPGGTVTINDQNNMLTVNGVNGMGLDLSAATANLTLTTPLMLGGSQNWLIVGGRTITLNGTNTIANGNNNVTISGGGTLSVTYNNTAVISAGQGAGGWTLNGSTLSWNVGNGSNFISLVNFMGTTNSTLTLAGATMSMIEAANSGNHQQTFASLTLNPGATLFTIGRNSNSQFKEIFTALPIRNVGGVAALPTINSSSWVAIGPSGTTLGYATYGSSDFARTAGTGASVTAPTYVNDTWGAGSNTTVTASSSPAADATTGTLRFGSNGVFTVTLSGTNTISTGGILMNSAVGTNAATITGGSLTSGNTTSDGYHDLIAINNNTNTATGTLVINSAIVDSGANAVGLTKSGSGKLILGGANTFTGPSTLCAGEVQLGNSGAWGGGSALRFAPNATLSGTAATLTLNGNNATVGGLDLTQTGISPTIRNANAVAATLTVNLAGGTNTFSGILQDGSGGGACGVAKNGGGTLILGGTLGYSGATTVNNGTLKLNNTPSATSGYTADGLLDISSLPGASLSLSGTQFLCGTGTVSGSVTMAGGTTLAPGAGTASTGGSGVLTLADLTLANNVTVNVGLSASNSNNCQAGVGTLTLPASGTVTLNLYMPGGASPFAAAGTYNLFQCTNLVNGTSLASRFTIGTTVAGYLTSFSTSSGPGGSTYVTLTLTASGTTGAWITDADGNWTVASNWSSNPNVPGSAGDSAILGAGSALRTVTLDADEAIGTLAMTNANSYVIAGSQTLTLDNASSGAVVNVSAGTSNAIQTAVKLNDDVTVTVGGGKALAVSGNIGNTSSARTITLAGTGLTALSGNNSYGPSAGTVGTTVTGGGTLQLGHNNALGAGDLSVAGNYTVQAGAAGLSVGNNIGVVGGITATVDGNGNDATLGGVISGAGVLAKVGNGTLSLGTANTFSGGTMIGAGAVGVAAEGTEGNAGNLGVVPVSQVANNIILKGGTLMATASVNLHTNRGIGIGPVAGSSGGTGRLDAASGATFTVSGVIASAGNTGANNLVVNGVAVSPGTVVLSGTNTFNGTTTINGGSLKLGNPLALQGSVLDYDNQGGTVSFGTLTSATLGGLSGAQNLGLLNDGAMAVALTVGANGIDTSYSGNLSGTGATLAKSGAGTLTLTGTNNYTGVTSVYGGVLQIGAGSVLLNTNVTDVVNGGELHVSGTLTAGALSVYGSSGLSVSNGLVMIGNLLNLNPLNNSQNSLISVMSGTLSAGSMNMNRMGSNFGSQPTAGSTTYGYYQNGGTVTIATNVTVCTGGASANSSSNLRIDSGSLTVGGSVTLSGGATGGRWTVLDVNGGTVTVTNTTTGINIGANNQGGNALLLIRGGMVTAGKVGLGSASGFGSVVINQTNGWLYVGSGGIVPVGTNSTPSVTLMGGTLGAVADWSSSMNMTLGNYTIQAADSNNTAHGITLSGVLNGGALTKTGAGTLTLSNTNTFTGAAAVNNGTLVVNGTLFTNTVSVASNATLAGACTINGPLSLQPGAYLSPGVGGTGTLSLAQSPASLTGGVLIATITTNGTCGALAVAGSVVASDLSLNVQTPGTVPYSVDSVTLVTATNITGQFASASVPSGWSVRYEGTTSILLVRQKGTLLMVR